MFIKSIVLDGFKSYGNRVEITGFDPEFNAITGLNGTGKSNILDSICFVLGITNLSNVRAGSLQELIYKHGQAGITKATVSITFDNRDKRQCPIGYENHDEITVTRQVVMGGKNKYLINGINVQNKRVSDLFCSVQLNVNNPHFLIMQGRITKVLNMKPPEILSMVEEAAGTRMYEAKKQAAQKTIEKKDAKMRELNDIIREDIAPKLQKLQDERAQFQEYQKVVRELENLTRLYIAWKYVSAEESTKAAGGKVTEVEDSIKEMKQTIKNHEKESKEVDKQITQLNKKLDEESGSVLKQLEAELATLEQSEATLSSAHKAAQEALSTHEKRARLLKSACADDEKALATKTSQLEKVSASSSVLRAAGEDSAARLAAARAHYLAVSEGREGAADSLQDLLIAAKKEASEASTRISQSGMERAHLEETLRSVSRDFQASSAQFQKDQASIHQLELAVDKLQSELSSLNFDESRYGELQSESRRLRESTRPLGEQVARLAGSLARCQFHYTSPTPDFDRTKVAGRLIRLFTVRDPLYCTALEKAAGGRLYNVVVDTEVTGKLVLQRGQLNSRVTIIPLNKITPHAISEQTLRLAQEIGGGPENVQLALDLVTYPSHLSAAMKWVFGSTLVCRDTDTARRVTFHPRVRQRCVTLDGDVFDYSGTLSGGAREEGGSELVRLAELRALELELERRQQETARLDHELAELQRAADTHAATKQRCEMMSHELAVTRARLATTSHAQTHTEIEAMKQRLLQLTTQLEQDQKIQKEASQRAKELDAKLKDIKGHREREFKKAEENLARAKQEAEQYSAAWQSGSQEFETLQLEVGELARAVANSAQLLAASRAAAAELADTAAEQQQLHQAALEKVREHQHRIKCQKRDIASRSGDVTRLQQRKETLAKEAADLQLKIKEQEYKIKELHTEAAECEKRIKTLETENPWIASEREYFGLAGGLYDFAGQRASVAGQRLAQLTATRDKLARGLNARAHTLLGREEEQYQDVMRKKKIVEADRAKLVQVMCELDEKKKKTLVGACSQVNRDFGSIFSSLLPGAQAQLTPPPGLSVLDGLQVMVGFNGAWKESLGELSGGQRSLVALALVLALLLFQPAPLYILDEVDAALDLSHTQNIGHMLKEHFKRSQFIIVSLKDGMFNNANVLFRTKFVDGMSSVQRTVNTRR